MMKVSWDEDVCIHSGNCVRGLPKVFQVKDGNFVIDTRAASEEEIRAVVEACPSGALKIESRRASE
jgi:uncharacterized Fe-S cluster protein YjdI